MLIDRFMPDYDHTEVHRLEIDAPPDVVYDALWTTDISASPVVRALLVLRSVPKLLAGAAAEAPATFRLETILRAGFGLLAEEKGRELVVGVSGRFWRPVDNLLPFDRAEFDGPVPPGTARGVWNFSVTETSPGRTELRTETRVACGDAASRRKFAAYWLFVRPFSGLIRILMLRAVARECRAKAA